MQPTATRQHTAAGHAGGATKEKIWRRSSRSPFIPANPSVRWAVERSARCPLVRLHFFFSFEFVLLETGQEASSGRSRKGGSQLAQKLLAVPSFVVQNGPAWSRSTRRATASDRAQISRLSRIRGSLDQSRETPVTSEVMNPRRHCPCWT